MKEEIFRIVADHFDVPPSEVTLETLLVDLDADSVDFVSILCEIEDRFEIELPDDLGELRHEVRTIADVIRLFEATD